MKKLLCILSLGLLASPALSAKNQENCPVAVLKNAIDQDKSHDEALAELKALDPTIAEILQKIIAAPEGQRETVGKQAASKLSLGLKIKLGFALKKYNQAILKEWLNKKKSTTAAVIATKIENKHKPKSS